MANSIGKFWLPPFDPASPLVVHQWPAGHTIGDREMVKGESFDASLVDSRTLVRLYERRWIAMVDEAPQPPPTIPTQMELNFLEYGAAFTGEYSAAT